MGVFPGSRKGTGGIGCNGQDFLLSRSVLGQGVEPADLAAVLTPPDQSFPFIQLKPAEVRLRRSEFGRISEDHAPVL